jgi:hypothetical protein
MSKEQTRSNTPITAEEFDRVIRQINSVDTSQDQWDVRKQKIDILKEFTQAKVLEALEEPLKYMEEQRNILLDRNVHFHEYVRKTKLEEINEIINKIQKYTNKK